VQLRFGPHPSDVAPASRGILTEPVSEHRYRHLTVRFRRPTGGEPAAISREQLSLFPLPNSIRHFAMVAGPLFSAPISRGHF
jgi:hypothetical protein